VNKELVRLLVVEHDTADVELYVKELERAGFEVRSEIVSTQAGFLGHLRSGVYDIVLADYRLPDWTGMDALAMLRANGWDIPLILITGSLGDERAVECVKLGAADYIIKQHLARLPMAVRRALEERRLRDERALALNALNATEERYRVLFESMPIPVWVSDVETHQVLAVNAAAVHHYGYSREEFLALRIEDLRPPEDIVRLQEQVHTAHQNGGTQSSGCWRHRKRDGSLILVDVTWHSLTWNGRRAEIVAASDITERTRAEEALAESETRYRKVIEASFDGIDVTEGGVVREANRGFAEMFGYDQDEVIGRSVLDFVADESVEAVQQRITEEVEGTFELVGKRKDGTKILLEATARIHHISGRPVRLTALRDVTEKRLLEDQFRQAQKMEAVGRLAGGVAHDFNNLLTVIISCVELILMDTEQGSPLRENLEEIRKASQAAAGLTGQLLAFSRQQVIEPKLVTIEEVLARAEKMLQRLIGEDVELVTVLNQHPATVKIDPGQLEQVIMNLAVNARDAMPDGGKLTLETSAVELQDAYVRSHWPAIAGRFALLAVSDTGIGMTQQTRARIFEPFFTTKQMGEGTGLGLATVYGIVKQGGGFIWVYSEPGQGATFKIYLPRVDEAPTATQPMRATTSLVGTETILLTEDAPALRGTARQILERYGYNVLEAPNGKEALTLASSRPGPIHLLLTDVVMPGMSGRELAERFTAQRPEVKVLYMSGYTDDAVVRHGVLRPGIAYLQKPFTPDALARKVREVLDPAPLLPA
jgi:two-component system, cell cycle sensor histidine kinase and response regulator CckA